MTECSYKELQGKRTIITGDIGSGKTVLTRKLLMEAIEMGENVTVVDFAPDVTIVDGVKIGGYLVQYEQGCRVLKSGSIATPRLSAKDSYELLRLAGHNAEITETLLTEFTRNPTPVLFINDTSIHLQSGDIQPILLAIKEAETVVLNGYVGEYLKEDHDTGLSERERSLMKKLAQSMDQEIKL